MKREAGQARREDLIRRNEVEREREREREREASNLSGSKR